MKAIISSFVFLLSLSFPILLAAGLFDDEIKIVGGKEAKSGAYPWEVSVGSLIEVPVKKRMRKLQHTRVKLASHFCGGVLLTHGWVLTAAHCITPFMDRTKVWASPPVGVGNAQHDLKKIYEEGRIPVKRIIVPKEYSEADPTTPGDLALLELQDPLLDAQPACLVQDKDSPFSPLTIIGWGNTERLFLDESTGKWSPPFKPARKLKEAAMKDVSLKEDTICSKRSDLICIDATKAGDSSCKGDSGGSLVYKNNLVVGITSFGGAKRIGDHTYETCNGDAVYTRLSQYIDWIEENINDKVCIK
jgi:secreted trypsin-like serine protease